VVITGTGFDTAPANDNVSFNGVAATVSAATATQLTVKVPLNAGTGNITLSVDNSVTVSGPVFTYKIPVTISSISVNSGTYNTQVVITGTGFDAKPANDKVFFNGKAATVSAATATQLTVTVPSNAGTGNITLSVNNGVTVTGPVFTYNAAAPATISSISVNTGPFNTVVVITGTGFDATAANDKVFFNGKAATVSAATTTQLTVVVPLGAGTGNITVSVNNGAAVSGPVFTYQYTGVVTTLIGNPNQSKQYNILAYFNYPTGVAVDKSGNVYVADSKNNLIAKVTPGGVVSTLAGTNAGQPGKADGTGTLASFWIPISIALDPTGNLYVTDAANGLIRKITPAGVVTTIKTSGLSFTYPWGITIDAAGNLYVTDANTVLKITTAGVVSILAGNSKPGVLNGTGSSAYFNSPAGIAADATGNLFVADNHDNSIRKVTPAAVVTTFAGDVNGTYGSNDGSGTAARFFYPFGVAFDAAGNLYVSDDSNRIRMITKAGVVTTIAGSGAAGSTDGTGKAASFSDPRGIAVDAAGNIYVADMGNGAIRKITLQ
jgi:sugar lactone lactonase YvrE